MQGKRVGVRLFKAFLLCLVVVAVIGVIGGGIFRQEDHCRHSGRVSI